MIYQNTKPQEGVDACGPLMEMFSKSFDYLGMEFAGSILVKAYEKGEIKENREELERAYEFGKSL